MRKLKGVISSHGARKTAVVEVTGLKKHPKYRKYYRKSKKFKAHDEKDEYKVGDLVAIEETRPVSKDKRWRITGLLKRRDSAGAAESRPEEQN